MARLHFIIHPVEGPLTRRQPKTDTAIWITFGNRDTGVLERGPDRGFAPV